MAIHNQYDGEVVDGATNVQKREIPVSIQWSPTERLIDNRKAVYQQAVYRDTYEEVNIQVYHKTYWVVDQYSTEAASPERTHAVDGIITEVDFKRWLLNQDKSTSQCRVPMTTGCKICFTEHAEPLPKAQTVLACLNLESITMLGKLTCWMPTK